MRPKTHLVTRDLYGMPRENTACGRPVLWHTDAGRIFVHATTETVADVTCRVCKQFSGSTHTRAR